MRLVTPLRFAVAASAILLALSPALGQSFPDQPIRIMVPTPGRRHGGHSSRVFAQKVKENTGATVIVENKTGANGVLASDYVAKSAPNGLTVLIGFQGTNAVLPHLDPKLPYKPLTDFEPVVLVASAPCVLVVHPSFPAKTVKEFVEIVKQKPGGYSYASAGFGTTHHLAAELFKIAADVESRRRHLSRRGARQPGRHRRAHPDRVRQPRQCDEQHQRRPRAGAGRHQREPRPAASGRSDHG